MSHMEQASADVAFLKQVVARRQKPGGSPAWIGPMFGVITLAGCVWTDVRPESAHFYWLIVPTLGFLISGSAGRQQVAQLGEFDAEVRRKITLHWSTCLLGCAPLIVLAAFGKMDGHLLGQLVLLVVGIVNFLAGVHLDRRWLLPGLAMMIGSVLVSVVPHWGWSASGVLIFLSLMLNASATKNPNEARG